MRVITIHNTEFVDVAELAEEMEISKRTLLKAVKDANLRGQKVGCNHYIRYDDFNDWFVNNSFSKGMNCE